VKHVLHDMCDGITRVNVYTRGQTTLLREFKPTSVISGQKYYCIGWSNIDYCCPWHSCSPSDVGWFNWGHLFTIHYTEGGI